MGDSFWKFEKNTNSIKQGIRINCLGLWDPVFLNAKRPTDAVS